MGSSFIGLLIALVQGGLISVSVKRFGQRMLIIGGFLLWTIGMFLFELAEKSWMIYAFLIPYALGGMAGPTLQGILSNQVPDQEQGNLEGALTGMISVTTIIGPALAAYLFYNFAGEGAWSYFPDAPYIAAVLLLLLATIIVAYALRKVKLDS